MSTIENPALEKISFRTQWASQVIREYLASIQQEAPAVPTTNADKYHLLPIKNSRFKGQKGDEPLHVGIIGAGVAGLFTAMIFDHLKEKYHLNVNYQILEANQEDRLGGRLYTYHFKDGGPHDYYDVGAMRFPRIKVMERTFELFKELDMKDEIPSKDFIPPKGSLIPYHMKGPNQPAYYNSIQFAPKMPRPLRASDFSIPGLPAYIVNEDAGDLVSRTIKQFINEYKENGSKAFWFRLMNEADDYSVRQWMTKYGYDYKTIEFLETLNYGTRWYDQALSEMILENMNFDSDRWVCVEGGSQEIAYRMGKKLEQQAIEFKKKVTAISYVNDDHQEVNVTVQGEKDPRTYDAVFNSAPLGAMSHMQLEGLKLDFWTKSAIRSLGYGASCKVGIRFRSLWWKENDLNIDKGGVGKTDLPIRCCVYPSYNIYDANKEPGVLLVSYTWSQDAERIGALINRSSPDSEEELKLLLFHDLARLHAKKDDPKDYQRLYDIISTAYWDHYAYNWYADPHTCGAFAYFGPGQFKNMYPHITGGNGKHVIIGEAASAHHAWVVGALESAVRGVYTFLHKHAKHNEACYEAARAYEKDEICQPYGPLPAEFDRLPDVGLPGVDGGTRTEETPSQLGEMARMQVLFEEIRLRQGGDRLDPKQIKREEVKSIVVPSSA